MIFNLQVGYQWGFVLFSSLAALTIAFYILKVVTDKKFGSIANSFIYAMLISSFVTMPFVAKTPSKSAIIHNSLVKHHSVDEEKVERILSEKSGLKLTTPFSNRNEKTWVNEEGVGFKCKVEYEEIGLKKIRAFLVCSKNNEEIQVYPSIEHQ